MFLIHIRVMLRKNICHTLPQKAIRMSPKSRMLATSILKSFACSSDIGSETVGDITTSVANYMQHYLLSLKPNDLYRAIVHKWQLSPPSGRPPARLLHFLIKNEIGTFLALFAHHGQYTIYADVFFIEQVGIIKKYFWRHYNKVIKNQSSSDNRGFHC